MADRFNPRQGGRVKQLPEGIALDLHNVLHGDVDALVDGFLFEHGHHAPSLYIITGQSARMHQCVELALKACGATWDHGEPPRRSQIRIVKF